MKFPAKLKTAALVTLTTAKRQSVQVIRFIVLKKDDFLSKIKDLQKILSATHVLGLRPRTWVARLPHFV